MIFNSQTPWRPGQRDIFDEGLKNIAFFHYWEAYNSSILMCETKYAPSKKGLRDIKGDLVSF